MLTAAVTASASAADQPACFEGKHHQRGSFSVSAGTHYADEGTPLTLLPDLCLHTNGRGDAAAAEPQSTGSEKAVRKVQKRAQGYARTEPDGRSHPKVEAHRVPGGK